MGVIGVRRRDPMGGLGCPRRAIALGTFPMAPMPPMPTAAPDRGCARTWLRLPVGLRPLWAAGRGGLGRVDLRPWPLRPERRRP